ncbi:MAG TPA: GAF and ANTAR domain-containing protein [Streptosporangiaceae bacterium]|jgi:GAF domain-containing protein
MLRLSRELAERIANVTRLLADDDSDGPLRQLTDLALELIPGSVAAGVVAADEASWSSAASTPGVAELHRDQLRRGEGPVAEALRYGEARRVDDAQADVRWPSIASAMVREGFRSCLVLPLRTDSRPGGALAIYGADAAAFSGAGDDIALLFAAQGGVAMRNAADYRGCRRLVENLHAALASRAVIEQAKGILVAEYGWPPDVAFKRLSIQSQNTNKKVRDIAADLVEGRINREQFRDV